VVSVWCMVCACVWEGGREKEALRTELRTEEKGFPISVTFKAAS
jgi:hypothetical protein